MISSGRFSPSCNSKPLFTTANAAVSVSPCKTQLGFAFVPRKSSTSALLAAVFKNRRLSFHGVGGGRRSTGFTLSARKKQQKGGAMVLEMDDSDDEFDLDGSDDELELGGDGDDDEDTFVPFGKMKRWLEKKPRGFGEGKEYDVSIEEKLVEEIEKNKQAQIENVIAKPKSKKDQQKNIAKANDVVEAGVRVRVLNLPKKKNIHRDLTAAFKLVPGVVSINPAVSGNKKTKDPICKGFAFVHFKSDKDATRFVEMFSSQSVTFGKIQKQIKCELVDPKAPNLDQKKSVDNRFVPRLPIRALEVDLKLNSDLGDSCLDTLEETILDKYEGSHVKLGNEHAATQLIVSGQEEDEETDSDLDEWEDAILDEYEGSDVELSDEHAATQHTVSGQVEDEETDSELDEWEDTILDEYEGSDVEVVRRGQEHAIETLESSSSKDLNGGDRDSKILRKKFGSLTSDSAYLKQLLPKSKEEKTAPSQKPVVKGKVESSPKKKKLTVKAKEVKIPKLSIGGSSKRLKVKEKAVLSDVFSKYGAKAALAAQEDS